MFENRRQSPSNHRRRQINTCRLRRHHLLSLHFHLRAFSRAYVSEKDMECAYPADPAAIARKIQRTCSERNPNENPNAGTATAKSKLNTASFRNPQYHNPAPGRMRLRSDALVECFMRTPIQIPLPTKRRSLYFNRNNCGAERRRGQSVH